MIDTILYHLIWKPIRRRVKAILGLKTRGGAKPKPATFDIFTKADKMERRK